MPVESKNAEVRWCCKNCKHYKQTYFGHSFAKYYCWNEGSYNYSIPTDQNDSCDDFEPSEVEGRKMLDEILREYFGCEKAFLDEPKELKGADGEVEYDYLTTEGWQAYGRLIDLLYDLQSVGALDANDVIDNLDSVISGREY